MATPSVSFNKDTWGQELTFSTGIDLTGYTELRLLVKNPRVESIETTSYLVAETPITNGDVTFTVPETLGGDVFWDVDGDWDLTMRVSYSDGRHESANVQVRIYRTNQTR